MEVKGYCREAVNIHRHAVLKEINNRQSFAFKEDEKSYISLIQVCISRKNRPNIFTEVLLNNIYCGLI